MFKKIPFSWQYFIFFSLLFLSSAAQMLFKFSGFWLGFVNGIQLVMLIVLFVQAIAHYRSKRQQA